MLLHISLLLSTTTDAETRNFKFIVQKTPVKRLCKTHSTITVNGQFPGPTLEVLKGDTVSVRVVNRAPPYNITIHWHGIRQIGTAWADGPEYVTQCPIRPGRSYTYRFTIHCQEGTLWWHAHSSWLRATVYGALIIRSRPATPPPPFLPKPDREATILIGEWWDGNPQDVLRQASLTGAPPNASDAYTINGQPGLLYKCSANDTVVIPTDPGETTILRIINAALNQELFFSVAHHTLTVVAADASYNKPFRTSVLMLPPGMTADISITADQPPCQYEIAVSAYESAQAVIIDTTTATAIFKYNSPTCLSPIKPIPAFVPPSNDTATATLFVEKFRSLEIPPRRRLPIEIDHHLFFTVGLGIVNCNTHARARNCQGPLKGTRFSASMNNVSFVLPTNVSILEAHHLGVPGVFTTDFPATPPVEFDYTGNVSQSMWAPVMATKLYKLEFGSRVQLVLQGTSLVKAENHPIHLHGYDFYVVAQGFGNFDAENDSSKFNLVDPPQRNTVGVPVNGWAVIRFVADNPGIWMMHCHLDFHINWGLAMAFLVENGEGEMEALSAPPPDLPEC